MQLKECPSDSQSKVQMPLDGSSKIQSDHCNANNENNIVFHDPVQDSRRLEVEGDQENSSMVLFPSPATLLVRSASGGLGALEVWQTTAPRRREGFRSLFRLFSSVFFGMVTQRLHVKSE
jgi:hypothetical protein